MYHEKESIRGVVATLLNERELVISVGGDSGVAVGTRLRILEKPRVIINPDTNEELGRLQREKVRVKVVEVHQKFCVARTYETYQTKGSGIFNPYRATLQGLGEVIGTGPVTRVRTLKNSDRPLGFAEIETANSYVELGDPAIEIDEVEIEEGQKKLSGVAG